MSQLMDKKLKYLQFYAEKIVYLNIGIFSRGARD